MTYYHVKRHSVSCIHKAWNGFQTLGMYTYIHRKPHVKPQNGAAINTGQHTPHVINLGQWRPKEHMNTQQWVTGAGKQLRLHQHCSTSSAFRPMTVAHFHLHIMCNTQPLSHHTTHYWTYSMLEYTYSSSIHLVTDGGVQLELVNDQPDHISMALLSCSVDHGPSTIVRAVEQRLHHGGQVVDGVDMATPCS